MQSPGFPEPEGIATGNGRRETLGQAAEEARRNRTETGREAAGEIPGSRGSRETAGKTAGHRFAHGQVPAPHTGPAPVRTAGTRTPGQGPGEKNFPGIKISGSVDRLPKRRRTEEMETRNITLYSFGGIGCGRSTPAFGASAPQTADNGTRRFFQIADAACCTDCGHRERPVPAERPHQKPIKS